jgi:hypothetical protein
MAFVFLSFVAGFFIVGGIVYYLKRRGVLKAAADAAKQAVKDDVNSFKDRIG